MSALKMITAAPNEVCVERRFNAPVALVWRAFTEPTIVQRWLTGPPGHTMPICEIDLRVDGAWRYVWKMPEGEMEAYGTYREVVPYERIVHTETFAMWPDQQSLITTTFHAEADHTLVRMVMAFASTETRDAVLMTGMTDGMEMSYQRLDDLLPDMA
jgi:uncharacterized protein YndB with AHSA1/START domain